MTISLNKNTYAGAGNNGFTIMESLLAALLLSASLVVLFSIVNQATFSHADISGGEIAAMLADETLERIFTGLDKLPEEKNKIAGDFSANYPNYSWQAVIEPLDTGVLKVNVKVLWTLKEKSNEISVSTFFYKETGSK